MMTPSIALIVVLRFDLNTPIFVAHNVGTSSRVASDLNYDER